VTTYFVVRKYFKNWVTICSTFVSNSALLDGYSGARFDGPWYEVIRRLEL